MRRREKKNAEKEIRFLKVAEALKQKEASSALAARSFSPLPDFQSDNFAGESDCGFSQ